MYKQIIIARKDLGMSPGKLAAQVSHGSMAFLTKMINDNTCRICENNHLSSHLYNDYVSPSIKQLAKEAEERGEEIFYASPVPGKPGEYELCDPKYHYDVNFTIDAGIYENWINGIFTKVVLAARNKNHLLKAKTMAEELGMMEGKDFFLIRDNCLTELAPEEDGRTLTVIGFKPMPEEVIDQIGKKYQLYR